MAKELSQTDKTPLIAVSPMALELWYEGPTVVVADKPVGLPVHPADAKGTNSLVNGLFQSNRWLAEMETSHTPGVIHVLAPEDRGLVLVAKSDETAEELRQLYAAGRITFSYRVRVPAPLTPASTDAVTVFDHQTYDEVTVWDIDSPIGNTEDLRRQWIPDSGHGAYFVLYRLQVPMLHETLTVGFGERIWLPSIDLYTAPP